MTDLSSLPYLCSSLSLLEQVIENDVHSVISSLRRHFNPTKGPRHSPARAFLASWRRRRGGPGVEKGRKGRNTDPFLLLVREISLLKLHSKRVEIPTLSTLTVPGDPGDGPAPLLLPFRYQ